MKANRVEFWLCWLSQTMTAWALEESRFISYRLFRVSFSKSKQAVVLHNGAWHVNPMESLWTGSSSSSCCCCWHVSVLTALMWTWWQKSCERSYRDAIVNIRAITAAIRLLGYKTVLFTCLWLERELINGNSITSTKKQPVSFLFYFILKKQFTQKWKSAEKMLRCRWVCFFIRFGEL